jgi:hypothetical protein
LDLFVDVGVKDSASRLISMGCDDNSVFQDAKIGVITQVKEIVVPFMIGVHCFPHYTNLAMLVLLKLNLVAWLEVLLQAMHFFSLIHLRSSLSSKKFYDVFIGKGNKLLKNVKRRWINMLSPMKCVMEQY